MSNETNQCHVMTHQARVARSRTCRVSEHRRLKHAIPTDVGVTLCGDDMRVTDTFNQWLSCARCRSALTAV